VEKRRSIDPAALALLGGAALAWLFRDTPALARVLGTGLPALSLFGKGTAALLLTAGLYRARAVIQRVAGAVLAKLDATEARLEQLPGLQAKAIRAVTIAVLIGGVTLGGLESTRLGAYLETRVIDLFFRLRFPERSQVELATSELTSSLRQDDVVVLGLDDETIAHLGWPMPRINYARLIDVVAAAKPASLSFDVSLVDPGREHPEWDLAIGDAAARAGNVAFTFAVARGTTEAPAALSPAAVKAVDANSIPWHASAAGLPEYSELIGGPAVLTPVIDPVAQHARAIAMANVVLDGDDDVLRHSLLVARLGQRLLPSLSLRLAAQTLEVPLEQIRVFPGSHLELGGKRRIPIDALGRTLVRYQGRHDSHGDGPFRYVSLWSLIRTDATVTLTGNPLGDDQRFVVDEQTKVTRDGSPIALAELELKPGTRLAGKARYSTDPGRVLELELKPADGTEPDFELLDETTLRFTTTLGTVKHNAGDVSALTGKHLLVGSTALAAADLRNSPLGEMPGVEHHATMLANLLHDDFFHLSPGWTNALLVLGAALVAALIGVSLSGELGLLLTGLLVLLTFGASFLLFSAGRYVPVVGPSFALGATSLGCVVLGARAARNARGRAEKDREFVRSTFGRYLTEQVVQQLLDSPDGLKLGGKREFVTIMMTDLRGFTSMCGSMEPEGVVKLLNHYLEAMTRIITKYGGTIDEFIGDAILVVFGAPLPLEQTEARAVACAIEMLNAMPEINRWNVEQRLPTVEMGIGVHSGEVVLGNIGSELRAKYGIVGSTINLTSRVESFTVGGQVLLSEATRSRAGDILQLGASQVVSPKGVKGTLTIHEALGVGAPFNVALQSAAEELVAPSAPLELRFGLVKGKQVAELSHVARVEALSALGMELWVDTELATLADLQMRVVDGDGLRPGDLYGKILKTNVRPNVVYLRLTSVPPELKPVLEAARQAAAQPPAVVPESAMVST
jgi:class 3 adenylate cyclase/CHASE2 domain-containing sensor protein